MEEKEKNIKEVVDEDFDEEETEEEYGFDVVGPCWCYVCEEDPVEIPAEELQKDLKK